MPPTPTLARPPIYALTSFLFLGAFSRLTHGVYTPRYYAYQTYRQPDDGSVVSMIVPVLDITLGLLLLLAPQRSARRTGAAITFVVMQTLGLVMQFSAGKDFLGDVVLLALAIATVWATSR